MAYIIHPPPVSPESLAAQAPKLYEACLWLLSSYEGSNGKHADMDGHDLDTALCFAEEAISKLEVTGPGLVI
jgi:hypothetical protein